MRKWMLAAGTAFLLVGCEAKDASEKTSSLVDSKEVSAVETDTAASSEAKKKGAKKRLKNYPQEELARREDAVKLSGTIEVPGYEKGLIQIDVFYAGKSGEGNGPLTTARFEKPGPFELLLPPEVESVELNAILDFKGDGPQFDDATATYEKNPVKVGKDVSGIVIQIDKENTKPIPPHDPNKVDLDADKPPWEQGETSAEASTAEKEAPKGEPEPAAPGAEGGPKEGVNPEGGGE